MIKSINYWSLPGGLAGSCPIAEAINLAKSTGFEGLELSIGVSGVLTPTTTFSECERIRCMCDSSDLVVETLASGMSWVYNPTSNDEKVREKAIEFHLAALQRASWLGCQALLFVPGVVTSPIAPGEVVRYDIALSRARTAISRLLEAAEKYEIDLCLENVWNGLLLSPIELSDFVDSFGSERLGVYFDVGNVLRYHQYPPHWIELLGHRIKRVHVKDFTEKFDWAGSYSFCELGGGEVPWRETMRALDAIGYDSTIVAEIMPFLEGNLEQTSLALDAILSFSETHFQSNQRRIDAPETAVGNNHKPLTRNAANLRNRP